MFWLARGLLILPAVGLVALSFGANAYFWHATMAHDATAQTAWVAISILCGLVKVGVPVAFVILAIGWRDQPAVAAAFAVALVFDVFSGLGFSALTRGDAVASRQHDAAPVVELVRQRDDAAAKLDRFADARLTARIQVERDAAKLRAPNCSLRTNASGEPCRALAALDAELADAKERDRLAAVVADLSGKTSTAAPVRDADPQISAIALALSAVGLSPDRETLAKAFGLLLVLLVELGSTALPRAAFVRVPAAPLPVERRAVAAPVPVEAEPVAPAKPRRASRAKVDPLEVIRAACAGRMAIAGASLTPDGWLYVSQRAIADVVGLSPPTVGRKIEEARRAGTILVRTDSRGSAIRLNPAEAAAA
jgi:CRP-like cAMP-binding protein